MRFVIIIATTAAMLCSVVPSTRASEDALSSDTLDEATLAERDDFSDIKEYVEDDDDDKMVKDYANEMDNYIYSLDEAEVAGRKTLNWCEEVALLGSNVCIEAYCRRGTVTIIATLDNKRLLKERFSVKKTTFTYCTTYSGIEGCLYVTDIHTQNNGKDVSFKYRAEVAFLYEGSPSREANLTC